MTVDVKCFDVLIFRFISLKVVGKLNFFLSMIMYKLSNLVAFELASAIVTDSYLPHHRETKTYPIFLLSYFLIHVIVPTPSQLLMFYAIRKD